VDSPDFEHEDGVVGLAAEFRGVELGEDVFEGFPIDEFINAREDIFREILVVRCSPIVIGDLSFLNICQTPLVFI